MHIPMEISTVLADPNTEAHVVVLRNLRNTMFLPIWVGASEANAIRMAMEHITIARPLTHDLLKTFLTYRDMHLEKAVIHDVHQNTYFASLHFKRNVPPLRPPEFLGDGMESFKKEVGKKERETCPKTGPADFQVDARPSDAIILSLRYGATLYVSKTVLDQQEAPIGFSEWLARTQPTVSESSPNA